MYNSETVLQPKETYNSRGICRVGRRDSYSKNNWSNTMNLSASNEGQSHCGTKASSQATFYRISRAIVPNVVCPNDLRISDKISFISDENR